MTVYPEVKINLGLSVLRRRDDGFHDLETLFLPCDAFHDELSIEPATGTEASFELVGGSWAPETDLSYKAWLMLREEFGIPPVNMRLVKGSPVGAGLGGGSADAAYALRALSEMFSLGLDDDALATRAAKLGSDCAFFIYGRPMFGEGRGEVLTPYELDLDAYRLELVIPDGSAVSTREAYASVLTRDAHPELGRMPLREALALPVEQWTDALVNDFEYSVFPAHPEIAAAKSEFYGRGAIYASMSGSGSAVFGLFKK